MYAEVEWCADKGEASCLQDTVDAVDRIKRLAGVLENLSTDNEVIAAASHDWCTVAEVCDVGGAALRIDI